MAVATNFNAVALRDNNLTVLSYGGGVAGAEPPLKGVGRNSVRPRGETSPLLLVLPQENV